MLPSYQKFASPSSDLEAIPTDTGVSNAQWRLRLIASAGTS